ncbi:MAG: PAS domain S-box protein [Chlorobiaceae bacterium]|nr:PAS domain S-box protein [Chlorobiaceae bacterium]
MSKRNKLPAEFDDLQKRAEERLGDGYGADADLSTSREDLHRLVHELDVHRIELEMQQEELLKSRTELEESLERYMELYDFAPIGYLSIDRNSKILQLNLTASRLLGIDRSNLVGQRFDRYVAFEDQPVFSRMLFDLFDQRRVEACELGLEKHEGGSSLNAPASGFGDFTFKLITVHIDAVVSNDLSQCRMALTDVSEQKRIHRDNLALQATMAQVRKLESIGRLAGGVAHDYNNTLQVMLGNIELMILMDPAKPVDQEKLSDLRHSVLRAAALTQQLLAFARDQPYSPEVLDFGATIDGILTMLRRLVSENISLSYTPPEERLMVKMDPSQVDQILANLVLNAQDAIQGIGTIAITLNQVTVGRSTPGYSPEISEGQYVRVSLIDDGCGMDSIALDNIFEPFYSTKSFSEGRGLGLSTVYGIVRQNNGFITVSSEIGKGTRFDVYLPCYAEEQARLSSNG